MRGSSDAGEVQDHARRRDAVSAILTHGERKMATERTEIQLDDPNSVDIDPQGYVVIRDKSAVDLIRNKVKAQAPAGGAQAAAVEVVVGVGVRF